ncbi:MAG: type II/IV secretion system protein [Phycisphaerales bacterium]|nr:MAG: type II/IV secretion system protein [Phycisphaerales bacterium]
MQIVDAIHTLWSGLPDPLQAEFGTASIVTELRFNPVWLTALMVWLYLCLYFVQRVQFSPLVPKPYKAIVNLITLFAGPIPLFLLLIVDSAKKSFQSGDSFFEVLTRHVEDMIANIRSRSTGAEEDDSAIRLLDSSGRSIDEIYSHGRMKREDSRILDMTEQLIADALDRRASDILIDPKDESTYAIRLRIDGVLRVIKELKADTCKAVVNSIKAVSSMDISEKRRPQDGAFMAKKGGATSSFRVASAGVLSGEKLSIRVLNKDASIFTVADLGLSAKQYSSIEEAVAKPSGMILICGPTGSGKTTTMYAMLNEIDRFTRNVITVEDPIEAVLEEASQIEINPKADITFAKALRSILRQDPDVICVGEIRDEETAEIALRASQTGHLVLATIHCDSNAAALVRLLDLGVSPLLLSSGLSLLVSQRLLRRLCDRCKRAADLTSGLVEEFKKKHIDASNMFEAVGCRHCDDTGYSGRMAICDIMVVTDELKLDIANDEMLVKHLRSDGARKDRFNLRKEGLRKAAVGATSLTEVKRVTG